MPKLTVLYSADHRRHVVIRRQIKTFVEAGFDVVVIDQGKEISAKLPSNYRHIRTVRVECRLLTRVLWSIVRRLRLEKLDDLFWWSIMWLRALLNAARLARMALKEKPDYCIADDLHAAWAALLASRLSRCMVVYSAHEVESEQGAGDEVRVQRAFLRSLEQKLIPKVDCLVVPSQSRAALYASRYRLRAEPIVVRNCPPVSSIPKSGKLHKVLGLPASIRLVLYHGALIPYRALDKLIQSAAYFDRDIVLVLIGEQGDYFRNVLAPLGATEQLEGRVFFLPYVPPDEISLYVASADLGIVIYENVNLNNYLCAPTKLYEFIMMRVPIAASGFPELVEFFAEYPVGVTFDPQDPMTIAAAVNRHFARSAGDWAKLWDVLTSARQRFTWENESLKWCRILRSNS